VQLRITDVEVLKKQVRKMVAGQVLAGSGATACRELAPMEGCRVCITAGYGAESGVPRAVAHDRLIWILDGYADISTADGQTTHVSQGESTVLTAGVAYRLVFPQLTVYLLVEGPEGSQ
jgi:uncharacterized cupin superfamily protein